ncbi:MAG TPA: methyltransferase domain-containing protein [Bryobacteraceae bacterium]|nr:methyltransferase domain-containing protein [Bryobacteraceae bacterium]
MRGICRIVLPALVLAISPGLPQVAKTANENYQTQAGREAVAKGLVGPDRDSTERPEDLVREIGVRPGMTVADVGTGPGYMLPFLSRAVGPEGRVLAEDIFDDFLASAKKRAESLGLANVQFIHGTERSPALPAHSVDLILALDSYHHYDYPRDMLSGFREALKPGGRLAIVEYYKRPGAMGGSDRALTHIRLDDSGVIQEVQSAGFAFVTEREHIPKSQYICIFAAKPTGAVR